MFPLPAPLSQPRREPLPWDASQPYRGLGWREVEAQDRGGKFSLDEHPVGRA